MKWSEVSLSNIGPIEKGRIRNRRVNVFMGPNNTGKSIAARIVYGLCRLNGRLARRCESEILRKSGRRARISDARLGAALIARFAGIAVRDVATRGRSRGHVGVETDGAGRRRFVFSRPKEGSLQGLEAALGTAAVRASRDAAYLPAGRVGVVQSLLPLPPQPAQAGDQASGSRRSEVGAPEYRERFVDILLEAAGGGLPSGAQEMLAALFQGPAETGGRRGIPRPPRRGPAGFAAGIEEGGSGVASSLPVAAGMCWVRRGGAVIVEEPEAHIEPLAQMKMAAAMARKAKAKNVNLLLATHSDYVVHGLLSMVENGDLRHADLGIYRFRRDAGRYAHIEEVPVTRDGLVDVELFGEALGALGTRL